MIQGMSQIPPLAPLHILKTQKLALDRFLVMMMVRQPFPGILRMAWTLSRYGIDQSYNSAAKILLQSVFPLVIYLFIYFKITKAL